MPHARRRSRIETELPFELRQQLNRMLIEGHTYDEVAVFLSRQGHTISRSAVGRYGKAFFEAYQNYLQFQDQSKALSSATDQGMPMEEAVGKMLLQKVMAAIVNGSFDILEVPRLISDVAKLQRSHVAMAQWKREIEKRADAAVESIKNKSKAIDPDTLRIIKEEIYGLVD